MAKPPVPVDPTRYRFPGRLVSTVGSLAASAVSQSLIRSQIARLTQSLTDDTSIAATLPPDMSAMFDSAFSSQLTTQVSNQGALDPAQLAPMASHTSTTLDPRLQLALINRRSGKRGLMTASTAGDEVAVVARVDSPEDWEAIADVVLGVTLGQTTAKDWIVTGRIPTARAEAVRAAPGVLSLKAAQPLRPELKATVESLGAAPEALPAGFEPAGGAGVVIGIVDFGCDFAHLNFRTGGGATRIEAIWDQAGIAAADSPAGYGRVYDADAINAALATTDPYSALSYGPRPDGLGQVGSHGTHVMDIATGNGRGSGQPGVAPEAVIIFVEASSADISWSGPGTVNQSFGDSVQLLEAVRFIFDQAGQRPCVVNLSLGTNGGPHDGTSLVEQGLDALLREAPNRAVVIAASNSQLDGIHTAGSVPGLGSTDIVWTHESDGGGEFELWFPGGEQLSVELIAPDGTRFGPVAPDANLPLGSSEVVIFISNRLHDPNNGDNVIGIWIADSVAGGDWTVRLTSLGQNAVDYHAWIERKDNAQSFFAMSVATHTLGSISTGKETIVVGSFDAHKPSMPLSNFSSCGPTRDGRKKPELSAPGHAVIAARSRTTNGVTRKSGTSMAAPAVTGLVGLLLADFHRQGIAAPISDIRRRVLDAVVRDPPTGARKRWDDRYGFGRAHV